MNRFTDKVVIVTGAGSGMGAAVVKRFAREGARVVLVGRSQEKLESVAVGLEPGQSLVHACDVSDWQAVQALVARTVEYFGQLDVLVNNAGVVKVGKIDESSVEDWQQIFNVDVNGVYYGCKAAMPHLIKQRGCIINVSSVSGLGGDWKMSAYNAAKGAISNFTRALALDAGADGVRVNAVCPGPTHSDMTASMFDDEKLMAKFAERIPLGRPAEADEVADVIAFLASHDARFVTGVNLPVDGGLSASNGQPPQN